MLKAMNGWTWDQLSGVLEMSVSMLTKCQRGERKMSEKSLRRLKSEEQKAGIVSDGQIFGGLLVRQGLQHENYPRALAELSKIRKCLGEICRSHAVLCSIVDRWPGVANPDAKSPMQRRLAAVGEKLP